MSITLVRLSGTYFLTLEPGENLSKLLTLGLLCCRVIAGLFSGSLATGPDFLKTLLLGFLKMPVVPLPRLLLRSCFSAVGGAGCLSVLLRLPIAQLLFEVIRSRKLPASGLCVAGAVGFLVPIRLPILHRLLELMRLSELPVDGLLVTEELCSFVPIRLPIPQLLLELIRSRKLPAGGL